MINLKQTLPAYLLALILAFGTLNNPTQAEQCKPNEYVYGANEIIDQLLVCSISKTFDLNLMHHGEFVKDTSKTFVDHGFSNKTTILYAKLNNLWTLRRTNSIESGWKCTPNKTIVNAIIQMDGLALDVVERVDIPLHRNQHKLAQHKPCKTFDIPLWLCRSTKQLFKTTRTWVNSAYFNLTLSQNTAATKPILEKLSLMFTCPETFKQKITYSPSAMYVLSKYMQVATEQNSNTDSSDKPRPKRSVQQDVQKDPMITESIVSHPMSFMSAQDGRGPASPPYHSSVNLITNKALEIVQNSIKDCIQNMDLDLSILVDQTSFSQRRFTANSSPSQSQEVPDADGAANIECSNKMWIQNRVGLANEMLNIQQQQQQHQPVNEKRSKYMLKYPVDPNQLLNPYGYYHENADQLLD